jgi:hypothetical protein
LPTGHVRDVFACASVASLLHRQEIDVIAGERADPVPGGQ